MIDIQEKYNALINALDNAGKLVDLLQQTLDDQGENYCEFEGLFMSGKLADSVSKYKKAASKAEEKFQLFMEENLKMLSFLSEYEVLCKQHSFYRSPGMKLITLLGSLGVNRAENLSEKLKCGKEILGLAAYRERVKNLSSVAVESARLEQRFALGVPCFDLRVTEIYPGAYIHYGTYSQTAAQNDETPIEWLVLDYDMINNKALLISRYGLDWRAYSSDEHRITWGNCSLRSWLNGTFLNKVFSQKEQKAIAITDVDNSKGQHYSKHEYDASGSNNTRDRIFLLSYAEANRYLNLVNNNESNILSQLIPTEYAVSHGAQQGCVQKYNDYFDVYSDNESDDDFNFTIFDDDIDNLSLEEDDIDDSAPKTSSLNEENIGDQKSESIKLEKEDIDESECEKANESLSMGWWLRSLVNNRGESACVNDAGAYDYSECKYRLLVRPAFWMDLSAI